MNSRGDNRGNLRAARLIAVTCAVLLVYGALGCWNASAASLKARAKATVAESDGAIVRASFSTESKKVRTLSKNSKFTITKERFASSKSAAKKDIWVYSKQDKGYVRSDLVTVMPKIMVKAKTVDAVNVRKGAGTGFAVMKTLQKGKGVKVVLAAYSKKGDLWYKIKCGSSYGYVSGDYLKLLRLIDGSAEAGLEEEKAEADKKAKGKSELGQEEGQPEKKETAAEEPAKEESAEKEPAKETVQEEAAEKEPVKETSKEEPAKTEPAKQTEEQSGPDKIGKNGFPKSYNKCLKQLKKAHPKWVFKPLDTGLTWKEATKRMTASRSTNTVYKTFAYPFRSVSKDCYNYLTHTYYPKDGNDFYSASNYAVYYFMDPRNWLDDSHIFMFEDEGYQKSYQTKALVKAVFESRNPELMANVGSFIKAAKDYDINAIYLASKALGEQGNSVGSKVVSGKRVYNVFNIGACDAAGEGGFSAGMQYARKGSSYLRPWTSIDLSIRGGAKYIAKNFMDQKQDSAYLEHFNVMNGLDGVGAHYYMSAVYAPRNNASAIAKSYKRYKIYDKKITFYIPVYHDMPKDACPKPSGNMKRDNNFYLKSLKVKIGGRNVTLISSNELCYQKSFTVDAGGADSVKITAKKASVTDASVSGTGTYQLKKGKNTLKVVCTASSGQKRVYKIRINN